MASRSLRVAALAAIVLGALTGTASARPGQAAPAPAVEAATITIVGHGYGHGRGMGQYGSYGYAVDLGQTRDQILGRYYGGTAATSLANPPMSVVINPPLSTGYAGTTGPTTVYLAQGVLSTEAGTGPVVAAPDRAVRVERVSAGTFQVSDGPTCDGPWTVRPATEATTWLRVLPAVADGALADTLKLCEGGSNARWLRGEIRAVDAGNRQYTVSVVPLDSYVRGVVPRESPASWGDAGGGKGMQALEVQAVAARSYGWADSLAGRYPFVATCDTVSCQVFGGRQRTWGGATVSEATQSDQATTATSGLVRSSAGKVSRTEFSSSTGGYTAGGTFPAVPDDGDSTGVNPYHTWTTVLSVASVEAYYGKGTFISATVKSRNGLGADGGRVLVLGLVFSGGTVDVSGDSFRSTFALRSNWFSIAAEPPPPPPPGPPPAGGYTLQADGTLAPFGAAPAASPQPIVPSSLARAVDLGGPSGRAGYMLDGYGGVHPFNGAPPVTDAPYWTGWDIANDVAVRDSLGGYTLDGWGGVHPFGGAPSPTGNPAHYSSAHGTDWAVRLAVRGSSASGYVVFSDGTVDAFGGAPAVVATALPSGRTVAGIVLGADQRSGAVIDSTGALLAFAPGVAPAPSGGGLTAVTGADGRPDGSGYIGVASGTVSAFGGASAATGSATGTSRRDLTAIVEPAGYVLDGWGGLHPLGGAAPAVSGTYWQGLDVARRVIVQPDGAGYVMDLYGGLHPFATAAAAAPGPAAGAPYWPGWDIARDVALVPGSTAGYLLDGFGGVHPINGAGAAGTSAYWSGWDIARRIVVNPSGAGGYVLDGWGGLHPFTIPGQPAPPYPGPTAYTQGVDSFRDVVLTGDGRGYTVDSSGGLHPFGGEAGTWSTAWGPGGVAGIASDDPARGVVIGVDVFGGVRSAPAGAPQLAPTATWPGWAIARDIGLRSR